MTEQPTRGAVLIGPSTRVPVRPRRARRRLAALLAAAVACGGAFATGASAGTELLSRRSFIRASGGAGVEAFDLTNGTTTFDRFADNVVNRGVPEDVASSAHQYSAPGLDEGGLEGAFAEGAIKASPEKPGDVAEASSQFDLVFRVTDEPAAFTFGAVIGCVGEASTLVQLATLVEPGGEGVPLVTAPVFAAWVDPADPTDPDGTSRTIERAGVLEPGTYTLSIHADSFITPNAADEGTAYFNAHLVLAPHGGAAPAVPLPPAAAAGAAMFAGMAVVRWTRRARRA